MLNRILADARPAKCPPAYARFGALRRIAAIVMPTYRLGWPQLAWWDDPRFNAYLDRFGERTGLNTARRWTVAELTRLVAHVPGDTAECGVFEGAGSFLIAAAAMSHRHARVHHLFDSFEGLSAPGIHDGEAWHAHDMARSLEQTQATLKSFSNLRWHKGWIPDTFASVADSKFAFVHVDVDLYEPTRASLDFFYPRMNPGGVIVCDDYGFITCPGATKAVDEFLDDRPEKMIALPNGGGFFIAGVSTAATRPCDALEAQAR